VPDSDSFAGPMVPGAPAADAPVRHAGRKDWLLRHLGNHFSLLVFGHAPEWAAGLAVKTVLVGDSGLDDAEGWAARRYDARPGTTYLVRPDQHVCARWRSASESQARAAIARACGQPI
jgi:3-(3-hydroxy-phenyl)propionate hydroxylase